MSDQSWNKYIDKGSAAQFLLAQTDHQSWGIFFNGDLPSNNTTQNQQTHNQETHANQLILDIFCILPVNLNHGLLGIIIISFCFATKSKNNKRQSTKNTPNRVWNRIWYSMDFTENEKMSIVYMHRLYYTVVSHSQHNVLHWDGLYIL